LNKIKFFRTPPPLTVRELSDRAEIAIGYVSELENDEEGFRSPSRDVMFRVAKALGQTVPEVFFPEEDKEVV
jgi:transcriptional regulator with XRE-family HTH domain